MRVSVLESGSEGLIVGRDRISAAQFDADNFTVRVAANPLLSGKGNRFPQLGQRPGLLEAGSKFDG